MIIYRSEYRHILSRAFQCKGSVFPSSILIASTCALATAALKVMMEEGYLPALTWLEKESVLKDNSCWSGFVFLVGFLTVFRTSQAYARFCDGCTAINTMRAEWYDACAALIAFTKHKGGQPGTTNFQELLIRLFSMLHAVALADIEDTSSRNVDEELTLRAAFKYALIDPGGIDTESLRTVKQCHAKVELIFQWIQQVVVENIDTGILTIPPPILSRSFQELSNGMVCFREAMKVSSIPFPFPYAQICEVLLMLHWLFTPLVVAQYVSSPGWGALFSFLQVFVYWSMNGIAIEIEHPFGMDANDLDASFMQDEMNTLLLLLLEPGTQRSPSLATWSRRAVSPGASAQDGQRAASPRKISLKDVWSLLEISDSLPARRLSKSKSSGMARHKKLRDRVQCMDSSRSMASELACEQGRSITPMSELEPRDPRFLPSEGSAALGSQWPSENCSRRSSMGSLLSVPPGTSPRRSLTVIVSEGGGSGGSGEDAVAPEESVACGEEEVEIWVQEPPPETPETPGFTEELPCGPPAAREPSIESPPNRGSAFRAAAPPRTRDWCPGAEKQSMPRPAPPSPCSNPRLKQLAPAKLLVGRPQQPPPTSGSLKVPGSDSSPVGRRGSSPKKQAA